MNRFLTLFFILSAFIAGFLIGRHSMSSTETVITVRDTVTVPHPVVKDSVIIRYVTRRVPVVTTDTVRLTDSVFVELPVTAKEYRGDGYYARVSGFEPSLDSIAFESTAISHIPPRRHASRWGLGITAGIGVTPDLRLQPSITVGITYRLTR